MTGGSRRLGDLLGDELAGKTVPPTEARRQLTMEQLENAAALFAVQHGLKAATIIKDLRGSGLGALVRAALDVEMPKRRVGAKEKPDQKWQDVAAVEKEILRGLRTEEAISAAYIARKHQGRKYITRSGFATSYRRAVRNLSPIARLFALQSKSSSVILKADKVE